MAYLLIEIAEPEKRMKVIYFSSPVCHRCKMIEPGLESLVTRKGLNLTKVNTSKEIDLAVRYNVLSLPTLIFFEGDNEVKRLTSGEVSLIAIEKVFAEFSQKEKSKASSM